MTTILKTLIQMDGYNGLLHVYTITFFHSGPFRSRNIWQKVSKRTFLEYRLVLSLISSFSYRLFGPIYEILPPIRSVLLRASVESVREALKQATPIVRFPFRSNSNRVANFYAHLYVASNDSGVIPFHTATALYSTIRKFPTLFSGFPCKEHFRTIDLLSHPSTITNKIPLNAQNF